MRIILLVIVFTIVSTAAKAKDKIDVFNENKGSVVKIYSMGLPGAGIVYYHSSGSGFAIKEKGLILTNQHVIDESHGIYVVSNTDSEKPDTAVARVVWEDEDLDIAALRVDDMDLPLLKLADYTKVIQGDEVLILGFPGSSVKSDEIKVTSGILSSSTQDSTLMTTAAVNPGNSGGPALNMSGELIGQVYAKIVGVDVEATGFLRNNRYVKEALDSLENEERINKKEMMGTKNQDAYEMMVMADAEYTRIKDAQDSTEELNHVNNAIDMMRKVVQMDQNFAMPKYLLANYIYKKALLLCEMNLESADETADDLIVEFNEVLADAKATGNREDYADELNDKIKYRVYSYSDSDDIKCSRWRDRVDSYDDFSRMADRRKEEFSEYIRYGRTPDLLLDALVNPTWERNYYKKYDALIKEIPVGITLSRYFSLAGDYEGSGLTGAMDYLELEAEPFDDLKILLGVAVSSFTGTESRTIDEFSVYDFEESGSTPIRLGVVAYDFRLRYTVTSVENVTVPLWNLEYTTGMPGDRNGDVGSFSYLGIGQYDFELADIAISAGHAINMWDSGVWLNGELMLGFGPVEELIQFGLGLGYRY